MDSRSKVAAWTSRPNFIKGSSSPWYATPSGPAMVISVTDCLSMFGVVPIAEDELITLALTHWQVLHAV